MFFSCHDDPEKYLAARQDLVFIRPMIDWGYGKLIQRLEKSNGAMEEKKGFLIAGTNSGAGKTTISLGIMAWLKREGYRVAPFKVGPDFIDPAHHTRITGTVSRNLDGWMMSREYNVNTFRRGISRADIAVVEGVMGLYDGFDGKSDAGSTALMAKWLDLPVILVVNAESMARSAAAIVKGFVEFDPDLQFAGVVFNNLGSENHYQYLKDAMEEYVSIPVLGGLQRNDEISMPERHLGLVTDDDHMLTQNDINRLAEWIERGVDTWKLVNGITASGAEKTYEAPTASSTLPVRIGVARDAAFCFYYQDNLDMMKFCGADLVYFSPLKDRRLPENLKGIYFGGGYPELFAERLSKNQSMLEDVKQASDQGMPIYGECGGFMYLCAWFFEKDSRKMSLTGCFPFATRLLDHLKTLGYRKISLAAETVIGVKNMKARGHEFHYSEIIDPERIDEARDVSLVYSVSTGKGGDIRPEGYYRKRTLGSYVHLHFGSNPKFCERFVRSCLKYSSI